MNVVRLRLVSAGGVAEGVGQYRVPRKAGQTAQQAARGLQSRLHHTQASPSPDKHYIFRFPLDVLDNGPNKRVRAQEKLIDEKRKRTTALHTWRVYSRTHQPQIQA